MIASSRTKSGDPGRRDALLAALQRTRKSLEDCKGGRFGWNLRAASWGCAQLPNRIYKRAGQRVLDLQREVEGLLAFIKRYDERWPHCAGNAALRGSDENSSTSQWTHRLARTLVHRVVRLHRRFRTGPLPGDDVDRCDAARSVI